MFHSVFSETIWMVDTRVSLLMTTQKSTLQDRICNLHHFDKLEIVFEITNVIQSEQVEDIASHKLSSNKPQNFVPNQIVCWDI